MRVLQGIPIRIFAYTMRRGRDERGRDEREREREREMQKSELSLHRAQRGGCVGFNALLFFIFL